MKNLLVELFLFVCVFLKQKINIFSYIFDLCGRVDDKKIFTRSISENKTTFFLALLSSLLLPLKPFFTAN